MVQILKTREITLSAIWQDRWKSLFAWLRSATGGGLTTIPRDYVSGLVTSVGTDTDHDIDIAIGTGRADDDSFGIALESAITKQIDANWAEGTDAGGFPSGLSLSADTEYHIFILGQKVPPYKVDAGFDTSTAAVNLLADATEFDVYRRIARTTTDGSSNLGEIILRTRDDLVAHAARHRAGGADDLLSEPGAIGGTTAAAGTFTTGLFDSVGIGASINNPLEVHHNAVGQFGASTNDQVAYFKNESAGNAATTLTLAPDSGSNFNIILFGSGASPANQVIINQRNNAPLIFQTNNTPRMAILGNGNIGIGSASPDTKLQVVGDLKVGDDNTNYMEVGTTGDVNFVGGAGLSYGSMSQMDIPTTITINTINVAEKVTGMSAGPLNVVTFSSSELTAVNAGDYAITWAVSFSMASGAGIEVEGAIGIDGVVQAEGSGHRTIGTGSDTGSMCGTAIHSLTANQTVIIMVTNESGTVNVVIDHASLMMYQIGG